MKPIRRSVLIPTKLPLPKTPSEPTLAAAAAAAGAMTVNHELPDNPKFKLVKRVKYTIEDFEEPASNLLPHPTSAVKTPRRSLKYEVFQYHREKLTRSVEPGHSAKCSNGPGRPKLKRKLSGSSSKKRSVIEEPPLPPGKAVHRKEPQSVSKLNKEPIVKSEILFDGFDESQLLSKTKASPVKFLKGGDGEVGQMGIVYCGTELLPKIEACDPTQLGGSDSLPDIEQTYTPYPEVPVERGTLIRTAEDLQFLLPDPVRKTEKYIPNGLASRINQLASRAKADRTFWKHNHTLPPEVSAADHDATTGSDQSTVSSLVLQIVTVFAQELHLITVICKECRTRNSTTQVPVAHPDTVKVVFEHQEYTKARLCTGCVFLLIRPWLTLPVSATERLIMCPSFFNVLKRPVEAQAVYAEAS